MTKHSNHPKLERRGYFHLRKRQEGFVNQNVRPLILMRMYDLKHD